MDRTIIGPWKAEEKELSQKFYRKLQGLFLIYPPSEDLRQCSTDEMFLKPNQHAFFHVMHYLFRLVDPVEFRKRFYWPLTDKRAEANFRSSTVEYLNYLNEKHQLQWANVKSYLLIKPGGMKFINFLLDLVGFVLQELTRIREKQLGLDSGNTQQFSELNLQRMNRQNKFFKEYTSAYLTEVDVQIDKLRQEMQNIKKELKNTSEAIKLSTTQITGHKFLIEFENSNRDEFKGAFTQNSSSILELNDPLVSLKEAIEKFQSKEAELKYDKSDLLRSLSKIRETHSTQMTAFISADKQLSNYVGGEEIKFDILLAAFICICPRLDESLSVTNQRPCLDDFVATQLQWLEGEFKQIELRITDFHKKLNENIKKRIIENKNMKTAIPIPQIEVGGSSVFNRNNDNNLLMLKFVSTPPIKLEITENIRMSNVRLPLLDDFNSLAMDNSHNTFSNIVPRSARKLMQRTVDNSFDRNKSRIIDPIKLLSTIKKDTSKTRNLSKLNLSTLASKWKERQHLFKSEELNVHAVVTPKKCTNDVAGSLEQIELSATLAQSPITPFAINEDTCIARTTTTTTTTLLNISNGTSGAGCGGSINTSASLLYTMKLGAVKKLQDATLNIQNSSTSPSGRLSSLLSTMETKQLLPCLKLNDNTLDASTTGTHTIIGAEENVLSAGVHNDVISNRLLHEANNFMPGLELNANTLNASTIDKYKAITEQEMEFSEDALCDISDSVLNDVIM